MKNKSLQEVMNDLARGQTIRIPKGKGRTSAGKNRRYLWLDADSLLAGLHKQMLDAQAKHQTLLKKYGRNDPMTDVAADAADSAKCAYDTRLIEVRRNARLRRRVLAALEQTRREVEQERRDKAVAWKQQMQECCDKQYRYEGARRQAASDYNMTLFLYWMLRISLERTQQSLSLANNFGSVCKNERTAAKAA